MRKGLYIAVALLVGTTACQVVETPEPASDRLTINITADPVYEDGIGPETKAVIHGTKMYWSPGDTLGVFPGRGSQVYFLVDSEGEAVSAPFDGGDWEFKANAVYRSYYPFFGDIYLNPAKIPIQFYKERNGRIELQTQEENDSSIHTSEYLYMYTDPQEVVNGNISFAYHHLWTVLKPIVTLPAGHYTKLTFSLDEPLFVVKGYFDLTSETPAIIGTEFADEVSMNLDITFDAASTLTAYYATAPLDMQGKTLTITITAESGTEYSYDYSPSKPYKAGTTYKLTSAESFANNVIYYTSTDGEIVAPYATDVFGASIISNEYVDGRGILTFDGDVTAVGDKAFFNRANLAKVMLPNSVLSIGCETFETCPSLTSVTIPNSVISIGDSAFCGCTSLENISIPDNVPNIGIGAFLACSSLTSITIPNSVTSIGSDAFYGCSSLASITIPDSVTSIGKGAFSYCKSLTSIILPSLITSIEENTFFSCSGLSSITIPELVTSIGSCAFSYCKNLTSVNIPESVTNIENQAFYGCSCLTSIVIPNSVTNIGYIAFSFCRSISSISIPESVTSIGEQAFRGCSGLVSIEVSSGNPKYDSRENCNAIIESDSNTLLFGCNNSVIPESVTSIGNFSFYECVDLKSIFIPKTVTSIGWQVFSGCSGITSIEVSSDNPVYDSRENCNAIIETNSNTLVSGCRNSVIPNSVTGIEDYAFLLCDSLTSIIIPESVTSIGIYAFYGCTSLSSVVVRASFPPVFVRSLSFAFDNTNCTIYVPWESVDSYKTADGWSEYADRIQANPADIPAVWLKAVDIIGDFWSWNVSLSDFIVSKTGSFTTMHIKLGQVERDNVYVGDATRRSLFSDLLPDATFKLGVFDDYGEFIESPSSDDGTYQLDISVFSILSDIVIKYNNDRAIVESFNIFIPVEFMYVGGSITKELVIHCVYN